MRSSYGGFIHVLFCFFIFFGPPSSADDVMRPGIISSPDTRGCSYNLTFSPWSFHLSFFFVFPSSAGDVRAADGGTPGQRGVHTAGAGKMRERGPMPRVARWKVALTPVMVVPVSDGKAGCCRKSTAK